MNIKWFRLRYWKVYAILEMGRKWLARYGLLLRVLNCMFIVYFCCKETILGNAGRRFDKGNELNIFFKELSIVAVNNSGFVNLFFFSFFFPYAMLHKSMQSLIAFISSKDWTNMRRKNIAGDHQNGPRHVPQEGCGISPQGGGWQLGCVWLHVQSWAY